MFENITKATGLSINNFGPKHFFTFTKEGDFILPPVRWEDMADVLHGDPDCIVAADEDRLLYQYNSDGNLTSIFDRRSGYTSIIMQKSPFGEDNLRILIRADTGDIITCTCITCQAPNARERRVVSSISFRLENEGADGTCADHTSLMDINYFIDEKTQSVYSATITYLVRASYRMVSVDEELNGIGCQSIAIVENNNYVDSKLDKFLSRSNGVTIADINEIRSFFEDRIVAADSYVFVFSRYIDGGVTINISDKETDLRDALIKLSNVRISPASEGIARKVIFYM